MAEAGVAVPASVTEELPVVYVLPDTGEAILTAIGVWIGSRRTTVTVLDDWLAAESVAVIVITLLPN